MATGDSDMNDDQIKGKASQVKGEVKDRAGGAMGDNSTQAEGKMEKLGGKIQEGVGNLKDKLTDDKSGDHANRDLDRK
jgi:uncharacterized protein YjbJ (UPF0337 family)